MNRLLKRVIGIILWSALIFSGTAQEKKNWLSVSFGGAIPSNDFKKKEIKIADSTLRCGFAKSGFGLNIAYTNQLSNNFGLTVMATGNINGTDIAALENALKKFADNLEIDDTRSSSSFGRWMTGMVLVGPNINFHLARHFMLEIRGLLGIGMGISPEYEYIATLAKPVNSLNSIEFLQQSDKAIGFGWNVGFGLKYHFNSFFVRANFDYAGSNLKYNDVHFTMRSVFSNSETIQEVKHAPKMSIQSDVMQITGGIGYLF